MTYNTSFINISNELKKNGIKNNTFMLETRNPELKKLNSLKIYDYFINCDEKYFSLIIDECRNNIWFFFREIARVGPHSSSFQLTKEFMLFIWCYEHELSCAIMSESRQRGLTTVMELLYIYHKLFSNEDKLDCYSKFEFTTNRYFLSDNIMEANKSLLSVFQNKIKKDILSNTDLEYTRIVGKQDTFLSVQQSTDATYDRYFNRFKDTSNELGINKYFTFGFDISKMDECIPMMISSFNKRFFTYMNVSTIPSKTIDDTLGIYFKYAIPEIKAEMLDLEKQGSNIYKIELKNIT